MDEIVLRGMTKWPNVPAVYGWLTLDRRGDWRIKEDRVTNKDIAAFIGRNYACDNEGRWFFQNGPQRVFVDLEYTPLVYRLTGEDTSTPVIEAHTGARSKSVTGVWIDDEGTLLLETEHGVGLLHDRDLDRVLSRFSDEESTSLSENLLEDLMERVRSGEAVPMWFKLGDSQIKVGSIESRNVPSRFHFTAHPLPS